MQMAGEGIAQRVHQLVSEPSQRSGEQTPSLIVAAAPNLSHVRPLVEFSEQAGE